MNLLLLGMNHKTAPVEIRERLDIACTEGFSPLGEIRGLPGVEEALYLSTCNRVEILVRGREDAAVEERLRELIFRHGNLSGADLARCLYVYRDADAVRHLFRVAAGLDSLIMGEPQILGQVKDAYRRAVEEEATGIILNKLLHRAFRVAKRVRTETGVANHAVSVSYAAVELAKKIFGALRGQKILLVGAGEMSELAARHLLKHGGDRLFVANRTWERAVRMAAEFQGTAVEFPRLGEALREADIVITSTGAPGYIITGEMVAGALKRRQNRLLFIIDIAVPRDVDPRAGAMDNVYLYNIDDLQEIADENMAIRKEEAARGEEIVSAEAEEFRAWFDTLTVVPTIVSLREKAEAIAAGELERADTWLRNLDPAAREEAALLARAIVNKLLHDPMTTLKEETREGAARAYAAALRRLFRLDGTDGEQ
ncbi:MAG TPA: glutamyl-tRNA reductase [Syntrophales bacterium]|jgi:glutamyl-tRNA reductase|nr:glutamyl-tRNA reductase [Syntrophales bacterium]HPC32507.1 glutamyl-tRNA reductase [Syntrophales bacterium]HQG34128.1 glutamyl-tRNA reductase [Syntrophales bacterium]HQI35318.1 glutamyl-tRNA reductase [Syntrophales bacterium]HQJ29752.1 glutamyl-tRNA reductase [Syntrophales bacterium]